MIRWCTLNKGADVNDEDTAEIQVERLLGTYQKALRLHQKKQYAEAKRLYQEISSNELVAKKESDTDTATALTIQNSPLVMLRFLVYKNYASILESEFVASDTKDPQIAKHAIELYFQALTADPTEASLWYPIGELAHALGYYRFARLAFENGVYSDVSQQRKLDINAPIGSSMISDPAKIHKALQSGPIHPGQWKCMEGLCNVLYDIGDFGLCQYYVQQGLARFPQWAVGARLQKQLNMSSTNEDAMENEKLVIDQEPPATMSVTVAKPDWSLLIETLLQQYVDMTWKESSSDPENEHPLLFINTLLNIKVNIPKPVTASQEVEEEPQQPLQSQQQQQHPVSETPDHPPTEVLIADQDRPMAEAFRSDAEGTQASPIILLDNGDAEMSAKDTSTGDVAEPSNTDEETSKKREREEEEGSEAGEDNEFEYEEKRATLRASKRQRDKMENKEASRQKMLAEEKVADDKIQALFDQVTSIDPELFPNRHPWYDVLMDGKENATRLFYEWFDIKISQLDSSYAWDVDHPSIKSQISKGHAAHRRYDIFQRTKRDTVATTTPLSSDEALLKFVQKLNDKNSGITDVLCQLTLALLEEDVHHGSLPSTEESVASCLVDTILTLNNTLIGAIMHGDLCNESAENFHNWRMQIIVRVCERLVDRLITTIINTSAAEATESTKRRSTASAKQSEASIKQLSDLCQAWIGLFERCVMKEAMDIAVTYVDIQQLDRVDWIDKELLLRYWFVKGKMAQCDEDVEAAFSWYESCETLFSTPEMQNISILLQCEYDGILDKEHIVEKLHALQMGKQSVLVRTKMNAKDYKGVVDLVETMVTTRLQTEPLSTYNEFYEMLTMLAKSYMETDHHLKAWQCYGQILYRSVKELIAHGSGQYQSSEISQKDDDPEFFRLLKQIDTLLQELTSLTLSDHMTDLSSASFEMELAKALIVLMRTSLIYIFRHPDFIPLVNNFTVPDMAPHVPSQASKSNIYNDIITKTWTLISSLLQKFLQKSHQFVSESLPVLADLLQTLHDELGEREICGASKGIFLTHLLGVLTKLDDAEYRRNIYQCYHCLYGVHLAAETDVIEEHNAAHEIITQKAAEPLFNLVVNTVLEKLERGSPLKSDLKDVTDTLMELFQKPPTDHYQVKANLKIIDGYLNRHIDLHQSIDSMLRYANIATIPVRSTKKKPISPVYFKIYWIMGKVLRLQVKHRSKINSERTMDDLEDAIEQYTNHLALSPYDAHGWYELGLCFMQLTDEELGWSASNIVLHKDRLAEYQKKAYHAFFRAWNLYRSGSAAFDDRTKLYEFFSNFGQLIYTMVAEPMGMESFQDQEKKRAMGQNGELYEVTPTAPQPAQAYKLSLIFFTKALKYKAPDGSEWKSLYMCGKCYDKLRRPAKEILNWYQKAEKRAAVYASKHGGHERILEPTYKLCSVLLKLLYRGDIQPEVAMDYVDIPTQDTTMSSTSESKTESLMAPQLPTLPSSTSAGPSSPYLYPLSLSITPQGVAVLQPTPSTSTFLPPSTETSSAKAMDHEPSISVNNLSNEASETNTEHSDHTEHVSSHLSSNYALIYNAIYDKLDEIRRIDKRKWHHQPIYLHAWMHYKIYHNVADAKSDMLQLFTLRSNTKSHINIWKPGFERPGKHFVYVHKYTLFMIELAKASNDPEFLKTLCRKLRRGQTVLLHDKEVFLAAYKAYLDLIRSELNSTNPDLDADMKRLLESSVDKQKFITLCENYAKSQAEAKASVKPDLLVLLQELFEIKRLNQGLTGDKTVDGNIQQCFVALVRSKMDWDSLFTPKNPEATASDEMSVDQPSLETEKPPDTGSSDNVTSATILTQAKSMVHTLSGATK
ncbi:uncharacterized protein BYT42DRAFT_587609 [Radiomyces spectabilis]|uniref:uncharacterized protein n=1 Tax=Radiomyces spectabilis TaxID=64574 RepID=UPI00221F38DE|nr:uncharacterized protein BYT42DRAFT_587609 [Radiomyces spectabilis]KAI8366707.1 hypothetical protein BYT42DRAFT_587609 [Radiomyces spectabilis]